MEADISYLSTPDGWSQERFLANGGFTVVFMNCNKGKYIERSVKSALDQDFPLLEMLFMDDASTDGSGDTMERLVREYAGRHKVAVIRNQNNHGISQQWNMAAKHATGEWLAMFCADDVARPDRISVSAALLKKFPYALGMCTNGAREDVNESGNGTPIFGDDRVLTVSGRDMASIGRNATAVIGATAVWHRSLFDEPLPVVPLDDVALRFVLQCKGCDTDGAVWICDGKTKSIVYGMNDGVTTQYDYGDLTRFADKRSRWLHMTRCNRNFNRLMLETWKELVEWSAQRASRRHVGFALAKRQELHYEILTGNTLTRLFSLPWLVVLLFRCRGIARLAGRTWATWIKLLIQEFFGLRFAALISTSFKCEK